MKTDTGIKTRQKGQSRGEKRRIIDYQRRYPWLKEACPLSPDAALQNIAKYLDGLQKGSDRVLRSTFYGSDTPWKQILNKWDLIARPIRQKMGKPFLDDYIGWKKKAGPRSVRKPWVEVHDIYANYFRPGRAKVDKTILDLAVQLALSYTGLRDYMGRLRPLSIEEGMERLPKTTNWGTPYYVHGRVYDYGIEIVDDTRTLTGEITLVQDHVPMYLALAEEMAIDLDHPGWGCPNLPFRRTDMKGPESDDVAQRAVWGQPHTISILDATIVGPLTTLVQEIEAKGFTSLINEEKLNTRIRYMLQKAEDSGAITVGIDKDKWDQNVDRVWIDAAFDVVGKMFQEDALPRYFDNLVRYFAESNMITPFGLLSGRKHCVSSGSGFTLWINTLIHIIVLCYCALRLDIPESDLEIECKGDDAVINLQEEQISRLVELTNTEVGMVNNLEKQWVVPGTTSFAKKVYRLDIPNGVPPSSRTVAAMMFFDMAKSQEFWVGPDDSMRWISQLNNFWDTPEFEALLQFAIAGDRKYGLGTKLQGGVDELIKRAGGELILDRKLGIEQYAGAYKDISWRNKDRIPIYRHIQSLTGGSGK